MENISNPANLDEAQLAQSLDPLSYEVLRKGATERPFTGEYTDTDKVGSYRCKACGNELFRSETKFHSGCGWPSFYATSESDSVAASISLATGTGVALILIGSIWI